MLTVYLVGMSDGVSRACRVAYSLGADRVVLVDSVEPNVRHLQTAKNLEIKRLPEKVFPEGVLILEVNGKFELDEIDWSSVTSIAVGGSSFSFSRECLSRYRSARVASRRPCLIGDQALAISLYARQTSLKGQPC